MDRVARLIGAALVALVVWGMLGSLGPCNGPLVLFMIPFLLPAMGLNRLFPGGEPQSYLAAAAIFWGMMAYILLCRFWHREPRSRYRPGAGGPSSRGTQARDGQGGGPQRDA